MFQSISPDCLHLDMIKKQRGELLTALALAVNGD
jgi:hypothetical protein